MGRKITMTGKNARYIEHRATGATPDNDRDIRLEGENAEYQEYAYGQASQPRQEEEPSEDDVKEAKYEVVKGDKVSQPVLEDAGEVSANAEIFIPDTDAIAKCFKFNNDFVKRSVSSLVADYYHGNYANLALIEITLFHHQQLKRRNSHKAFIMSLAAWGIITIADDKEYELIVMGVGDKYKRLPKEGYKEWDDKFKEDRLACERIGKILGPTMVYHL